MSYRIQIRRDVAATWTSVDPVLADGEWGYESDTGKLKVGDGTTVWSLLPYRLTSGEINTASNVNVGGVGVFKQKTVADLEFRGINAGSSKITVTLDAGNNEIDIDVVEANLIIASTQISDFAEAVQDVAGAAFIDSASIDFTYSDAGNTVTAVVLPGGVDHDSLLNFVSNEHINHASVTLTAGAGLTGGGDITANRTFAVDIPGQTSVTPATGDLVLIADVSDSNNIKKVTISDIVALAPAGFTAEDAQDAVGGILTDSASIDFTYNDAGNTITAVVLPAGVDHDALANFVANEHIDHTSVTLTAGTGLTGGGDISANRTFNLANTAVGAGSYGSATQVATFTVDAQGRLTAAANVSISLTSSVITDFTEAAQDAVGGILTDSSTIDFTYNDGANTITATVIQAGLDHGSIGGLADDDHTQYALLAGRSGGQTLTGGTVASNNLVLRSTSNATKGQVWIDETTASTSTTTGALRVDGGIGLAGALVFGGDPLPSTNNARSLGSSSLRMATLFSNRIANYTSTTVTPTVTGPVLLSGRYNNTGGGTTTVSVVSGGSSAANFLLGSVLNTSADTATFSVGGGGNFGGGVVNDGGTISIVGQSNFVWGRSAGAGTSISTDIAAEGNFVYGEAFPGAVGASSISASGAAAAGCFVGGWIQGSDTSATPSAINGSYFGCFAQGMIVDGGNIGAGGAGLGPFAQGYATLLGQIQSTGDGSFAQGYAEEGDISASARGTVAHGAVVGSYSIAASSSGAIALGYANGADITASGDGSGAFGYAYGGTNIVASASNAFQFARGTNSTADSLQIGVSGTGVKIYGSGQIDIPGVLNHDGTTLGFYAVTPVARPAAYTQTYSTATRTHSNLTSSTLTDSTTGTANTTVQDVGAAFSQATLNDNFADVVAQINALRVDLVNAKGVLNQVIDDLQSNGLLQ